MRGGQAIVESLIVLLVLLVGFFCFYDFAYGVVTRMLLQNGAARSARAATVGFNEFHRTKALRLGIIPVAGERLVPDKSRFPAGQLNELSFFRAYLQTETEPDARGMLLYERWNNLRHSLTEEEHALSVSVWLPLKRAMPWGLAKMMGVSPITGPASVQVTWPIENHARLYLENTP